MDAPSMTPERSRELAGLQRRAYGPDADIAHDPEALRRLHELEDMLRTDASSAAGGEDDSPAGLDLRKQAAVTTPPPVAVPSAPPGSPAADPSPQPAKARARWQRIPLWVSLAAIGALGVLVGLVVPAAVTPGADTTLRPNETAALALDEEWLESMLDWLRINDPPTVFEPFHNLQVLTAVSETGTTCLVVYWTNQWSDASCTPDGLIPTVDFVVYPGSPQPLDDLMPVGTVIRFVLHGDEVGVTVREPDGEQRSAAPR